MKTTYVYKKTNQILKEIKRTSEMKDSLDGLNRLETTEKRVGELVYRSIKIVQLRIDMEKY